MLQYVIAGLVLGGIYAISAAGLVVTYQSAGILNFSFGALAFFVARLFYYLNSQQHWNLAAAAVFSLLIAGPAIGILLYMVLFRFLRLSSTLIKVVVTLGLSVTIPPLATLAFGNKTILKAPGLAPQPVKVFHLAGVPVTMDQIIVYSFVILVVVLGAAVLRYTDVGLQIRAMVDSPAMTSLSGTNPNAVSIGVWATSTFLAGVVGVLSAPIIGLEPNDYTLLMAAAFAAVIAAQLRNLPMAVLVGLLMGVAGTLVQHYLPPSSTLTADVIPSIPFIVTAVFLVYYIARRGRVNEDAGIGGALDRAIAVQTDVSVTVDEHRGSIVTNRSMGWRTSLIGIALVGVLPLLLHGFWVGLVAAGVCYAIIFLSFSLVVGDGGMVWLCMVTFAGVGGLTVGQVATHHGWPVLAGALLGGVLAAPMGIILGMLTIRLGNLYVALVTLTFGLLMENLVFSRNTFLNNGIGVNLTRPSFVHGDRAFAYMALIIFAIVAVFVVNLRRSTTGMALTALRSSEAAAKTTGMSVLLMKVLLAGVASFIAGVGGALLAVEQGVALPSNYATLAGVVWLSVLVTQGIRSNIAALFAGLTFTLFPGVALAYLPTWFGQLPPIFFGLGAIALALFPEGILVMQARQWRVTGQMFNRLERQQKFTVAGTAALSLVAMVGFIAIFPHWWWVSFLGFSLVYHAMLVYMIAQGKSAGAVDPDAIDVAKPRAHALT